MAVQGFVDWRGKPINKARHGGVRAAMFIYFMVVMTNVAYVPIMMNLVTYLRGTMHMDVASSSNAVTNFVGVTCAFALLGAFISDSYISRFKSILIFGPLECLGFGLLAMQAHIPSLRPPGCDISIQSNNCKQVDGSNAILLYIAMYTLALGEGCLRSNLASLGGDQFDDDDPIELKQKTSFFNWFTFGISLGVSIGLIFIVWIESNKGWDYGFGLSALIILLGLLVVGSGFSLYRNLKPGGSPLTRMLKVFVAAFQRRKITLHENAVELQNERAKEDTTSTELLPHTKGFKFLDQALVSQTNAGDWSNCTVTQVEETKIILRMLPIYISAVISYIPIPLLLTFTIQQGTTMDTKLGKIHFYPATLMAIPAIFQMMILVLYDRIFVPVVRSFTGYAGGITQLQRVGIGFLSISLATSVAALIEGKRRNTAAEHGVLNSGAEVPMSVLWLGIQSFILGITDVTSFVGLLEFFNTEISRDMRSIGTAIFWCVQGLSSLLGTCLVDAVNRATRNEDGRVGWVEGKSLNQGHLDYFYWLLSVLGLIGFVNYLFWARKYVYRHNPYVAKL